MTDIASDTPPPEDGTTPAAEDPSLQQIRDLSAEIQKLRDEQQKYSGLVKGVVAAVAFPTVSVTLSGDNTVVAGIGYLNSYGPTVGDVVLLEKQGPDFVVMGTIATGTGWTSISLASGFTASTPCEYRVVNDQGSPKVQLRGRANRSSGTTIISSLPVAARPLSTRYLLGARGWGGGATGIQFVVNTGGSVTIDGSTAAPTASSDSVDPVDNTTSVDPNDNTNNSSSSDTGGANGDTSGFALGGYLSQAGSDLGHNHTIGHSHGMNHTHGVTGAHSHGVTGAHSHTITVATTAPDWVSFDGLEYWI